MKSAAQPLVTCGSLLYSYALGKQIHPERSKLVVFFFFFFFSLSLIFYYYPCLLQQECFMVLGMETETTGSAVLPQPWTKSC